MFLMKKMMKYLVIAVVAVLSACANSSGDGAITVKVKAIEQVQSYTYLLVKGKGPAYWIAVTSTEIGVGESLTYQGGLLMEDFYSKDLDRTFEKVVFLDDMEGSQASAMEKMGESSQGSSVKAPRLETNVEAEEGIVSIAELFSDPGAYEGKTIQVKGEVSKFNAAIMERNWIHIQDGTDFEGKYDLTLTSQESFEVGQVVTLEGIVALNRDFGYGYSYDIILEQATAVR
jgi:hypothetical protein